MNKVSPSLCWRAAAITAELLDGGVIALAAMPVTDIDWAGAAEGKAAGGHLVHHGTEREQIAASVEVFASCLFRRHVGYSTNGRAGTGEVSWTALTRRCPWPFQPRESAWRDRNREPLFDCVE